MRVVLALPPFNMSRSYSAAGTLKQRGILPSLGVGYVASSVEAHGHDVAFVDSSVLGLDTVGAAQAVLAEKPDVIGISCLTRLAPATYAMADELKRRNGSIPIVLGGPHVTCFPDEILQACSSIDILVPGEGEQTFADLLDHLATGKPLDEVLGIIYRDADGKVRTTPVRDPERNLDLFPHPARHIYPNDLYIPLPNQSRRRPVTTVMTSRGCPYGRCKFCYQGGRYSAPYRRRSAANVIDEIGRLVKDLGIREILFWDDNFCINPKWIHAFCDGLDREKLDLTWTVLGRVNTVTLDMLQRMFASGCYSVYYGLESGSQKMLDIINKGITLDDSRAAIEWARKAGMEVRGSFILGMPHETPALAEETIRFACELNVDWLIFFLYRLQPGTPLGDCAAEHGTILEEQLDMHAASYVPNGYASAQQLEATLRSAYRRYYLRPQYIARALSRAWRPSQLKNYWDAFRYWLSLAYAKQP
jgi:anaerobic magnesium-protoporphyrin IX monomethyl ester cyclase